MFKIEAMGVIPDTALEQMTFETDYIYIPLTLNDFNEKYRTMLESYINEEPITDVVISIIINFDKEKKQVKRLISVDICPLRNGFTNVEMAIPFTDDEWENFKKDVIFVYINSFKAVNCKTEVIRY